MAENKKMDAIDLVRVKKEKEEKELAKLSKKVPTVESLYKDIAFMKSFTDKMSSKVFKGDTLHIMNTTIMMEVLQQLKELNKNLVSDYEVEEEDEDQKPRTSKKLSRDK
jgi:hypothetical protein